MRVVSENLIEITTLYGETTLIFCDDIVEWIWTDSYHHDNSYGSIYYENDTTTINDSEVRVNRKEYEAFEEFMDNIFIGMLDNENHDPPSDSCDLEMLQ